jgi:hypothetical protein
LEFNDIYVEHKKIMQSAGAIVKEHRAKLEKYLTEQQRGAVETARRSGNQVVFSDLPLVPFAESGMKLEWKFWNGEKKYNEHHDGSDLKLRGQFTWDPKVPDVVRASGSDIDVGDIDVDDFINEPLTENMAAVMRDVLNAQVKKKYPHFNG